MPIGITISKNKGKEIWQVSEEIGIFIYCWQECKIVQSLWQTVWEFLKSKTFTIKLKQQFQPSVCI